ncbi:MAG: hypothetical protein Q4C78_02595 [Synergistaceae bacterium]|nr:hypothetical protein [Synergistaceae bacterium]
MAEKEKREQKRIARRKIKDTVFSKLFEDYDNLLLLYKALYPEDSDVTTDDLHEVLLENMLLNGLYNDLSFTVRDKFIVLLEAQSTWTLNILPRSLIYYANLLNEHIKRTGQNIYSTKKVEIPRPDIYVVYTGQREIKQPVLSLKDEFWAGTTSAVELTAKVIYLEKTSDLNIVEQYIRFAHIYDACVEEDKGNGKEKPDEATVVKAIDICLNEGVLTKFLTEHRLEVVSIMTTLFDEDYLREVDRREAYLEGEARGEANATRHFLELLKSGKTKEEILATYSI